jgi:hypothetical protein
MPGICNAYTKQPNIRGNGYEYKYLDVHPDIDNKNEDCKHFKKKLFALKRKTHRCRDCKHWVKTF